MERNSALPRGRGSVREAPSVFRWATRFVVCSGVRAMGSQDGRTKCCPHAASTVCQATLCPANMTDFTATAVHCFKLEASDIPNAPYRMHRNIHFASIFFFFGQSIIAALWLSKVCSSSASACLSCTRLERWQQKITACKIWFIEPERIS